MDDDAWLPGKRRKLSPLTQSARIDPSQEALRNGHDRPIDGEDNGCYLPLNQTLVIRWDTAQRINELRFVFDSDLNREDKDRKAGFKAKNARSFYCLDSKPWAMPETMLKGYRIEALTEKGEWELSFETENNYQRLNRVPMGVTAEAIRFTPISTWGAAEAHVFSIDIL